MASSVRVGDQQLPDLHQLLLEACEILDLECPQLYVRQNPGAQCLHLCHAGATPFVVMHTSLLELLTPAETQAVIAHELGHLKVRPQRLPDPGKFVGPGGFSCPWGEVLAQSLQSQMMEWVRCAEFTCDRAALLVAQDPGSSHPC
jgi:Zn-dependent protease with chaperone function